MHNNEFKYAAQLIAKGVQEIMHYLTLSDKKEPTSKAEVEARIKKAEEEKEKRAKEMWHKQEELRRKINKYFS